MMRRPLVIAVAAFPGGGKTTLAREVSRRCGGAPIVHYDLFEKATARQPGEISGWLARGAPLDELVGPDFVDEILRCRDIVADEAGTAQGCVIVDTPLGRAHAASRAVIDLVAWIDTPADLCLARTLRREIAQLRPDLDGTAQSRLIAWIDGYLQAYEPLLRRTQELQSRTVRATADLVLQPAAPAVLAERVLEAAAALRRSGTAGAGLERGA